MIKSVLRKIGLLKCADPNAKVKAIVRLPRSSTINYYGIAIKENCKVEVGESSQIGGSLSFDRADGFIRIGDRVFMNGSIVCAEKVELGDDILIAWGVTIVDHNSHSISFSQRANDVTDWQAGRKDWTHVKIKPVKICDKAWIGFNSIILKGVTVGEGAVVAAGSVVAKDVPPWTVVAGNPARIIREIPLHER